MGSGRRDGCSHGVDGEEAGDRSKGREGMEAPGLPAGREWERAGRRRRVEAGSGEGGRRWDWEDREVGDRAR